MSIGARTLLQELQALEVELHHPGVRCSRERLEQLLDPAFHEVGRSGQAYSRETIITYLSRESAPPDVRSEHFHVAALAPEVALLTYRSAHAQADGALTNHALRMSLWVRSDGNWRLRYHQGTPAGQVW